MTHDTRCFANIIYFIVLWNCNEVHTLSLFLDLIFPKYCVMLSSLRMIRCVFLEKLLLAFLLLLLTSLTANLEPWLLFEKIGKIIVSIHLSPKIYWNLMIESKKSTKTLDILQILLINQRQLKMITKQHQFNIQTLIP